MGELIKSKIKISSDFTIEKEYKDCISELINHEMVESMKNFIQHGDINCLEHSIYVSYISFLVCRQLKLDYLSAARGGLLHDFFLYDWHTEKPYKGLHGFNHSFIALQNANKYFKLNEREKDIIQKHMWPLTISLPRYKETVVVLLADKYCASREIVKFGNRKNVSKLKKILGI